MPTEKKRDYCRDVTAAEIKVAIKNFYRNDGSLIAFEVKNGSTWNENPNGDDHYRFDAVRITKSWIHPSMDIFEIKVSRSDFLRDEKLLAYKAYCNRLYLVVPEGMVDKSELPEGVGLMYYKPSPNRSKCPRLDSMGSIEERRRPTWRETSLPEQIYRYILYSRMDDPMASHLKAYEPGCFELQKLVSDKSAEEIELEKAKRKAKAKAKKEAAKQIKGGDIAYE